MLNFTKFSHMYVSQNNQMSYFVIHKRNLQKLIARPHATAALWPRVRIQGDFSQKSQKYAT